MMLANVEVFLTVPIEITLNASRKGRNFQPLFGGKALLTGWRKFDVKGVGWGHKCTKLI
jgi:hypothetical protein